MFSASSIAWSAGYRVARTLTTLLEHVPSCCLQRLCNVLLLRRSVWGMHRCCHPHAPAGASANASNLGASWSCCIASFSHLGFWGGHEGLPFDVNLLSIHPLGHSLLYSEAAPIAWGVVALSLTPDQNVCTDLKWNWVSKCVSLRTSTFQGAFVQVKLLRITIAPSGGSTCIPGEAATDACTRTNEHPSPSQKNSSLRRPASSPAACICGSHSGPSWNATPPAKENLTCRRTRIRVCGALPLDLNRRI